MEKLNDLLREYAQAIRRDDGAAFMHADAIRDLFRECGERPAALSDEHRDDFDVHVKELALRHRLARTPSGGWIFKNHELFRFAYALAASAPTFGEESTPDTVEAAKRAFAEWFAKNYPRDTLIYDPYWHAPKILRAAMNSISRARDAAPRRRAAGADG